MLVSDSGLPIFADTASHERCQYWIATADFPFLSWGARSLNPPQLWEQLIFKSLHFLLLLLLLPLSRQSRYRLFDDITLLSCFILRPSTSLPVIRFLSRVFLAFLSTVSSILSQTIKEEKMTDGRKGLNFLLRFHPFFPTSPPLSFAGTHTDGKRGNR